MAKENNPKSIAVIEENKNAIATDTIDDIPIHLENGAIYYIPNVFHNGLCQISGYSIDEMATLLFMNRADEYNQYVLQHYKNILVNILLDFEVNLLSSLSVCAQEYLAEYDRLESITLASIADALAEYAYPAKILTNEFIRSLIPDSLESEESYKHTTSYVEYRMHPIINMIAIQIYNNMRNMAQVQINTYHLSVKDINDLYNTINKTISHMMQIMVRENCVLSVRIMENFMTIFSYISKEHLIEVLK